jgi:hypothetical protein
MYVMFAIAVLSSLLAVILLSLEFGRPLFILACLAGTSRNGRYALVRDGRFA